MKPDIAQVETVVVEVLEIDDDKEGDVVDGNEEVLEVDFMTHDENPSDPLEQLLLESQQSESFEHLEPDIAQVETVVVEVLEIDDDKEGDVVDGNEEVLEVDFMTHDENPSDPLEQLLLESQQSESFEHLEPDIAQVETVVVEVLEIDDDKEGDVVDGNKEVEVEEIDNDVLVVLEVAVDESDVVDDVSNELEVVLITHDE